jgi:putative transposase
MTGQAMAVEVTARQRKILEALARAPSSSQQLAERCRIVLGSAQGQCNEHQALGLGVDRQRIRRWRTRWATAQGRLTAAEREGAQDKELERMIVSVLADAQRSGGPAKFSPEQVASIIALACESPADSELPVSHWTPSELAREAQKRGIVESISPRQVDRFLAGRAFGHTDRSTG